MEKLSIYELKSLVDSRFVDVENEVKFIKDKMEVIDDNTMIDTLDNLVKLAELLKEAYEARVEREEDLHAEELDKKWEEHTSED